MIGLGGKQALLIENKKGGYTLKRNLAHRGAGSTERALTSDENRLWNYLFAESGVLKLKANNHRRIGNAREQHQKAIKAQVEGIHLKKNVPWMLPGALLSLAGAAVLPLGWVFLVIAMFPAIFSGGLFAFLSSRGLMTLMVPFYGIMGVSIWVVQTIEAELPTLGEVTPPWIAGVGTLFAGVLFHVFYHLIKAPTRRGKKLMDEIEGFQHYLSVAEEDRLRLYAPSEIPEKNLQLFEDFLPYAVALGCEQQWAEKFEGALQAAGSSLSTGSYRPGFYENTGGVAPGESSGLTGMARDLSGSLSLIHI